MPAVADRAGLWPARRWRNDFEGDIARPVGHLLATAAEAATGDTVITVASKAMTTRIKPQPGTGVGEASVSIVLHADGTVDEVLEGKGKHAKKWEVKKRRLGSQKEGAVQLRVLDKNTIERTSGGPTHVLSIKILVDGPSCKADVAYTMKPGAKEMVMYSTGLGKMTHYSEIKPFEVKCTIE
jgi:hypothetical protein